MRAFKEFPCTVYELTHQNKVRKVTVTGKVHQWSSCTGTSSRGVVRAQDCYKTFAAAVEAGKKRLLARIKNHNKAIQAADKAMQALDQQMNNHLNPRKKAVIPCRNK